ncbi:MAG: hypothetical protein K9I94_07960 [Bacteroidales bacterium]|nr:hypothetical protein [Bacteroidales bacterium]
MKRLVLSGFLVFSFLLATTAQETGGTDEGYRKFRKVYHKALPEIRPSADNEEDTLDKSPDILPSWFTNSFNRDEKQFIPGISSPALPDSLALQQTRMHALILQALMNHARYFDMHDHFMNVEDLEGEYSKFNKITEFKAGFTFNPASLKAAEQHTTRFGEKIILYKVNDDSLQPRQQDSIRVNGFIFVTELQKNDRYQNEFIIDYQSVLYEDGSVSDSCRYKNIGVGKLSEIKSFMNGDELDIPVQYYKFKSAGEPNALVDTLRSSKLYYGLWNALITDILLKLPSYAQNNDVIISGTGDNYRQQKNISLNRQLTGYRLKTRLNAIAISGNDLSTNLQIIKQ